MTSTTNPLTPKGERRRQALIAAATELFLEHGFAKTTLEMIIEQAGGSRRTIYQLFGDKEGLFGAVLHQCCQDTVMLLRGADSGGLEPREALYRIGVRYLKSIFSPKSVALYRVVVRESANFPELGQAFMESGPEQGIRMLATYLQKQCDEGVLHLDNPELAAKIFLDMIKARQDMWVLLTDYIPGREEMEQSVRLAVDLFLEGCRVR